MAISTVQHGRKQRERTLVIFSAKCFRSCASAASSFFVSSVVAATPTTMVHGGVEENRGGASGKDQHLDLDIDQI